MCFVDYNIFSQSFGLLRLIFCPQKFQKRHLKDVSAGTMKIEVSHYYKKLYPPFLYLNITDYPAGASGASALHSHDVFQTILGVSGELRFHLSDQRMISCSPREILSIPPFVSHTWSVGDSPARMIQIIHQPMRIDRYGDLSALFGSLSTEPFRASLPKSKFNHIVQTLRHEILYHQTAGNMTVHACLLESFALFAREYRIPAVHHGGIPENQRMFQILKYIDDHQFTQLRLKDLASAMNLSSSRLSHIFQTFTGTSPIEYSNQLKIDQARNMLLFTELNISEIAENLGFRSLYYFSRLFKKHTGQSPSDYRKKQDRAK